ncbi:hypothetical protein [Ferruginibacter sp.]
MQPAFKIIVLILLSAAIFCSCKQNNRKEQSIAFRDSVLREYITIMDSVGRQDKTISFFDSTDDKYRVLKAFYYNDSPFLAYLKKRIELRSEYKYPDNPLYQLHYPLLKEIVAEEAYQFDYSSTFCDHNYVITIAKKGDSIGLHAVVFSLKNSVMGNTEIVLTKEIDKKLTQHNWEQFSNAMEYADFWGLVPYKEAIIYDGSPLKVQGITRNHFDMHITNTQTVKRISEENTALFTAFKIAMQLANLKNDCEK